VTASEDSCQQLLNDLRLTNDHLGQFLPHGVPMIAELL
jgi:hypothetical protein